MGFLRTKARLLPTQDGGYALIAAQHAPRALFEGIAWGGPQVFEETVKRLAGVRWRRLRMLWDVDRPEDIDQMAPLFLRRSAMRPAMMP